MKYGLRLHAVFHNVEELKKILQEIGNFVESYGIEDNPNCGCTEYDFNVQKVNAESVYDFIETLKQ